MNALAAFLTVCMTLSFCNLTEKFGLKSSENKDTKTNSDYKGTDEEIVKQRISELFDYCKNSEYKKAATYMADMKASKDETMRKGSLDYETDKAKVEGTCREIVQMIGSDLNFIKSSKKNTVTAWEVKGSSKNLIFAFAKVKENWILVDIDRV